MFWHECEFEYTETGLMYPYIRVSQPKLTSVKLFLIVNELWLAWEFF